jgi:hypothetical protein
MNIVLIALILIGIYYIYTTLSQQNDYKQTGGGCNCGVSMNNDQQDSPNDHIPSFLPLTSSIEGNNVPNDKYTDRTTMNVFDKSADNYTRKPFCKLCKSNMGTGNKCRCEDTNSLYAYATMFPEEKQESYTGCNKGASCNQDLLNYIDLNAIETNNNIVTENKPINLQINNSIPNHLITRVQLSELRDFEIEPANNYVAESPAYFQSEFTNLAAYFKLNPDIFDPLKDKRNMITPPAVPYVPYQKEWTNASDCFNNIKYDSVPKNPPIDFIATKVQ